MKKVSIQTYEAIIGILYDYVCELNDKCVLIEDVSEGCVELLDGDPELIVANARIKECISRIQYSIKTINEICKVLEEEKWYDLPLAIPPQYIDD